MTTLRDMKSKNKAELERLHSTRMFDSLIFGDMSSKIHAKACSDGTLLEKDIFNLVDPNHRISDKTISAALKTFNARNLDFAVAKHLQYDPNKKSPAGDFIIFIRETSGSISIIIVELKAGGPYDRKKIDGETRNLRKVAEIIGTQHPTIAIKTKIVSWMVKSRSGLAENFTLSSRHKDAITRDDEVWSGEELATNLRIGSYDGADTTMRALYAHEPRENREWLYKRIIAGAIEAGELDLFQAFIDQETSTSV